MTDTHCFFASDLHGRTDRYRSLFDAAIRERPRAVILGGDLLPHHWSRVVGAEDFVDDVLVTSVRRMRTELGDAAPRLLLILGNDDERAAEQRFLDGESEGLWEYLHLREVELAGYRVVGYCCVPPTPFLLKDWERYDVGRYVDPGCVSPEDGHRTVPFDPDEIRTGTIARDLDRLMRPGDLSTTVLVAHSPPYRTGLDRAGLDDQMVDHAPLDVHVGSIAVKRLIEDRQPWLTLHGHIHESSRITGTWRERIGRTHCFNGAHDGPELCLIRFDLENPAAATRELI
jgi:Icc-related predicted phosphoesterase